MPQQVDADHPVLRQIALGQHLPPLSVTGQTVHGQQNGTVVGAEPVGVESPHAPMESRVADGYRRARPGVSVAGGCIGVMPTARGAWSARLTAASPATVPAARAWPAEVSALIAGPHSADPEKPWSPYRVHGGPGTGKTSLLIDTAVARLHAEGVDPESVLVLTANRRAAGAVRDEITRRVLDSPAEREEGLKEGEGRTGEGSALREPLVRTIHSYAFGVLPAGRRHGQPAAAPDHRLRTGHDPA